jgi:hypothetical protein
MNKEDCEHCGYLLELSELDCECELKGCDINEIKTCKAAEMLKEQP